MNAIKKMVVTILLGGLWGGVWLFLAVMMIVFVTGETGTTVYFPTCFSGIVGALVTLYLSKKTKQENKVKNVLIIGGVIFLSLILTSFAEPFILGLPFTLSVIIISLLFSLSLSTSLNLTFSGIDFSLRGGYHIETLVIRMFKGFGFILFSMAVILPFYVMVVTSIKNQQQLLLNPLDLSIDFSQSFTTLIDSYIKLFTEYHFATFIINSTFISITTVIISLGFSIPGAYVVARLRFPGQRFFFHSILLIYMVPMIVLVIPLYAIFSQWGLRDSFIGLLIVYPATTIPVAIYMLQGYFTSIPNELEEAGLIDGLTRLQVILKITLPLSLPALASVSLYIFMIAWNEFLFAFMFLDSTSLFTLSRGVVSLNTSEVPRQYLMAGSVIATVPVLVLFLWFERFLVTGLTAGSIKG